MEFTKELAKRAVEPMELSEEHAKDAEEHAKDAKLSECPKMADGEVWKKRWRTTWTPPGGGKTWRLARIEATAGFVEEHWTAGATSSLTIVHAASVALVCHE